MITVKEILKDKSRDILTIAPQETVYRALEIMAEKDLGALVVVDGEKVVGLFSEYLMGRS